MITQRRKLTVQEKFYSMVANARGLILIAKVHQDGSLDNGLVVEDEDTGKWYEVKIEEVLPDEN